MLIHDIENMTSSGLKNNASDLAAKILDAIAGEALTQEELAERYIQARLDAAVRDEKLGEQGGIITSLQKGLNAAEEVLKAEVERMTQEAITATGEISRLTGALMERDTMVEKGKELLVEGRSLLVDERERANRMTIVATRNELAINGSAKLLNDAISQRLVDAADSGE